MLTVLLAVAVLAVGSAVSVTSSLMVCGPAVLNVWVKLSLAAVSCTAPSTVHLLSTMPLPGSAFDVDLNVTASPTRWGERPVNEAGRAADAVALEAPSATSAIAAVVRACRQVIVRVPPQVLRTRSHPRTTSMRSALTTSRPPPQFTRSRLWLRTSIVSLPGPPDTRLAPWPARRLSLPAPPERTSLPLPPDSTSLPAPPLSLSLPLLPNSWSAPAPPSSVSLPVKPVRRSLPRPPDSRSLLDPPLRRSLPASP